MSQASASSMPPPITMPCRAAMIGLLIRCSPRVIPPANPLRSTLRPRSGPPPSQPSTCVARSAPAQNAFSPFPERMARRTSGSSRKRVHASKSSSSTSVSMALSFSGRFRVMQAISPRFSYSTFGMGCPSGYGAWHWVELPQPGVGVTDLHHVMRYCNIAVVVVQWASSADEPRPLAAVLDRHLPAIEPLTARSVVLSTLLGYHPPELPVRALVRVGGLFDIAERSIRVALSRLVAEGDLLAENGTYRLTERLVRRQAQQEDSASPRSKPWTGDWAMAVVTSSARPLADRVALRKQMVDLRYTELREGVWIRPDNLIHRIDDLVVDQCTFFTCQYVDEHDLVQRLWNLPAWADTARHLDAALDQA